MKDIEKKDEEMSMEDFGIDAKKEILDIINDCPSIVKLGNNEYMVKPMRYYSLYRIFSLAMKMKVEDGDIHEDQAIITAMSTDLDAMCEILAIVLCNHLFTVDGEKVGFGELRTKNERLIDLMKAKVMESTFDTGQWSAIIIAAIKSIDLTGFFLHKKLVSSLMDSQMRRKQKAEETALQFMEAQSLRTQPIL